MNVRRCVSRYSIEGDCKDETQRLRAKVILYPGSIHVYWHIVRVLGLLRLVIGLKKLLRRLEKLYDIFDNDRDR